MTFQQFFELGKDAEHLVFFILVFFACWNLENIYGVTKDYEKWNHDKTNYLFILTGAVLQGILGFIFVKVILYENAVNYGISSWSNTAQIAVIFVGLDLTYYLYHLLMHKLKSVWKYHAVHHSDLVLNVSTSLREHPVESVIRLTQYMVSACILGPSFWIISLHQVVQVASKIIIHSNFILPAHIDKYVSMVFLTPNMHHIHHHHERPYTDSNFGDLFSIWDRMFGTFTYLSAKDVKFGLDTLESDKHLKFGDLVKINFNHDPNKMTKNTLVLPTDFDDLNVFEAIEQPTEAYS
jgi:sterol desaturase/sphingolipid hydroxylase (fatty acid hydroxylase superfamily)